MKPVLLFIPGMLNDDRVWRDVTAQMHDLAEVRVADVLSQDSIASMARDALALLKDVGPERPVHLVGFSMGGYVAIELLATHPTRWNAALLMSTSCLPDSEQSAAGREKAMAAFKADFETTVQGVALRGLAQPNPSLQGRLCEMMRDVGAATAIRQTRAISRRTDHRTALGALKLPVHVMCGRQDRITLPVWSQTLADTIPASTLHWVDGAGHMLPIEHPQAIGAVLRQMLTRSE